MRIVLLGAAGFVGRAIRAELQRSGHSTVSVVRPSRAATDSADGEVVPLDLARAVGKDDWLAVLAGADAIVNAAGLLRGKGLHLIHVAMPRALVAAAEEAAVKRVVLISAISARADVDTDYARTKIEGEAIVRGFAGHWAVLRPSLVYGHGSYGGTSLMRGMAGLPLAIPVPGKGDDMFSPIHAADVATCVRLACEGALGDRVELEPCGPEQLSLRQMLARYRAWLGFAPARFLAVPVRVMRFFGRIGDLAKDGPISTVSLDQLIAGNEGDGQAFTKAVGFRPRSLNEALRDCPAQVQDRWHAQLFFVAPLVRAALVLLWLSSAALGLFSGAERTGELVSALGLAPGWEAPLRYGGSLIDIALAAMLVSGRRLGFVTLAQLIVIAAYTLVIGFALPALWLDPLGPLLKNLPILVLVLVHRAIGRRW